MWFVVSGIVVGKKTPEKPKRKVSTEDLLEDLGDTVDKVRRNSLKVPNVFCTLAYLKSDT